MFTAFTVFRVFLYRGYVHAYFPSYSSL